MSSYETVTRLIAQQATTNKIIVEKSTVPVHTSEHMERILNSNKIRDDITFEIISNPEFLSEVSIFD
jgi:UDPglucose 6-dehydrogenase